MIIQHPDSDKLRTQYRDLQHDLRVILEEWFELNNTVRPELIKKYDELFGEREVELQKVTLVAEEIQRRVELFTMRAQRGAEFTAEEVQRIHEMVDNEFRKFTKRMNEAFTMSADEREQQSSLKHEKQQQEKGTEINKLYRAIVKHLHPDINGENPDFKRLWNNVQEAYTEKNISKLRTYYNILCIEEQILNEVITDEQGLEKLRSEVRQLEMKVDYERRKLQRIKTEEPFTFAELMKDDTWIEQQHTKLQKLIQTKQRQTQLAEEQLQAILGSKWDEYKKQNPKTKEQFDFQDDFLENTYFSMRA